MFCWAVVVVGWCCWCCCCGVVWCWVCSVGCVLVVEVVVWCCFVVIASSLVFVVGVLGVFWVVWWCACLVLCCYGSGVVWLFGVLLLWCWGGVVLVLCGVGVAQLEAPQAVATLRHLADNTQRPSQSIRYPLCNVLLPNCCPHRAAPKTRLSESLVSNRNPAPPCGQHPRPIQSIWYLCVMPPAQRVAQLESLQAVATLRHLADNI